MPLLPLENGGKLTDTLLGGFQFRFLGGVPALAAVLVLLPQVLTLVFRFIAELPENLVMASRATIFRMRKTRKPGPVGNRFTYTLGRALNALARLLNRTILHRHPMRTDFEYVLDASFREISGGIRSMSVSISFGLLLLCIGLYVTCLYLLQ